jgi:hypothetical protein
MDPKYLTLVQILDDLCTEAPESNQKYRPNSSNLEEINCARSLALTHLFLKVKCGIDTFTERENLTCDGKSDGGLDAYFIDRSTRKILLLQAKFRTTAEGFKDKEVSADELVKMELDRILKGKHDNSNGTSYNGKVHSFQKELQKIGDIALYHYQVIILANLKRYKDAQIKQLLGNFDYEIFDSSKIYDELVFPFCSSTYYDPSQIQIEINLSQKQQPNLAQTISVQGGNSEITVLFAPTKEVGRIMSKYRNALLKFNPRNYLSLTRNPVNKRIHESIIGLSTNEFAILNNGITFIADEIALTQRSGIENVGQLIITAPQIINGGQTASTLSEIYEKEYPGNTHVFDGKEVMLKIINLEGVGTRKPEIIEAVSNATNRQTRVTEADRRSNSLLFMKIQKALFSDFGYFFERKEGEFFYGIDCGVLTKRIVIDRADLVRSYMAFTGDPSKARGQAESELFTEETILTLFSGTPTIPEIFFAYRVYSTIKELERLHKRGKFLPKRRLGNAFRYGKFAVVASIGVNQPKVNTDIDKIDRDVVSLTQKVLKNWAQFEKFAIAGTANKDYFGRGEKDFDNYYKGSSLNADIKSFWRGVI